MIVFRSILFNIIFYIWTAGLAVLFTPLLALPRGAIVWGLETWAKGTMVLLRVICGTRIEIKGLEHKPQGASLVAAKHQSMWDTIIAHILVDDPAIILKAELAMIPFYGWHARRAKMIIVNRDAGSKALKKLVKDGKARIAENRPIVIFPEGTRSAPGAVPDYKPGIAALYNQLDVPCVPVALNSGLFWGRRSFLRHPGTITLAFLPPIEAGLKRKEFMRRLESEIETATAKLVENP
ncbi:MAG: lysophospholipid acyltransferase family protein [Alphaproteobacteria bacterium]